jgi:hypothetical protein
VARNRINDLRDHLFETLERLKDTDTPMEVDRAKAVCEVAREIISSARAELELVKLVGDAVPGSRFFDTPEERQLGESAGPRLARLGGAR